jgi:hypothetical protein
MRKNWLMPVLTLAACGVLLTGGCVSAAVAAPAAARAAAATGGNANIMILPWAVPELGGLRRHPWQADGLLARLLVAEAYTWTIWMRQRL